MDVWMEARMEGWMDGWKDGWVVGWMGGRFELKVVCWAGWTVVLAPGGSSHAFMFACF